MIETERAFMPQDVYDIRSMLSYEERLVLHHLSRTGTPGAIVDLGSFLGGSTLALASGGSHRGARVYAYDRFVLAGDWEREWLPDGVTLEIGQSTRAVFDRNIARVRDIVTVREGNVEDHGWTDDPIGVLFIDIAKSWSTADYVWRTFLPALHPGSFVIQQDLVHWGHPWCAIVMEHLAEHFEYLGWTWFSSAVYRCTSSVPAMTSPMLEELSCDEMLNLLERAARRIGEPGGGEIRLAAVGVLAAFERFDEARAHITDIAGRYDEQILPFIDEGFATLTRWIDDVEAGRVSAR